MQPHEFHYPHVTPVGVIRDSHRADDVRVDHDRQVRLVRESLLAIPVQGKPDAYGRGDSRK